MKTKKEKDAKERGTGSGQAPDKGWLRGSRAKAPRFAAFAAVLAGLVLVSGCETDDEEEAEVAPQRTSRPVAEETPAGTVYDNESTTVFTGRVISELGGGLSGVGVTWAPEHYVNEFGASFNTDTSVSVSSDVTGPDGFFAVTVKWDRDFGYGAISGRIVISRAGYPSQETVSIGPVTASSYSIGELYPGWMP